MSVNEKNILNSDASSITDKVFGDINGVYPKLQYSQFNLPDVNVLASDKGGGSALGNAMPVLSTPNPLDQKQPRNARAAVGVPPIVTDGAYPYKKVEETESGHIFVKSDVPHAEAIQTMHRTGTYTEYRPDGSFVTNITGKGYTAVADDYAIIVKGSCKIIIEGDCDFSVGGNFNLNVHGNYNCTVGGDSRTITAGSMNEECHGPKAETYGKELLQVIAADHYQVVAGNQDVGVSGNFTHATKGTASIASKGDMSVTTQGKQTVASKGDQEVSTQGKQNVSSSGNQTVSSAGTQTVASSGAQKLSSEAAQSLIGTSTLINSPTVNLGPGTVNVDGTLNVDGKVRFDGDLASNPPPPSWPSQGCSVSIGSGSSTEVDPPDAPKEVKLPDAQDIIDEFTNWTHTKGAMGADFSIDDMMDIEDDFGSVPSSMVDIAIKKGIVSAWPEPGNFEPGPGPVGTSDGTSWSNFDKLGNPHNNVFNSPTSAPTPITPDTSNISTDGSFKLSKHFTLAQLTASSNGGGIRAYNGVSAEEIVKNLMYLATNLLDPIFEHVGGKMKINSGFRSVVVTGSSSKSQHMIGQAADMAFPDMGADQYYHIAEWIRDNLDYDQLIMEYSSYSAWVHVSYKPGGGNRKMVFSQMNHKKIADGILAGKPVGDRVPKKA